MAFLDVCPLPSELSVINSNIVCPEEGCGKVFKASSALNMHLTKHHRNSCLTKRDSSVTVRYFCPDVKCVYHVNASRHFMQMKYLKQHYLKVHSEKIFSCQSCGKAFATQELLRYHIQVCGIKFTCSCGNSYSSYEALLTHSKRKQHTFDDKFKSGNKRVKHESTMEAPSKKDAYCFSVDMLQPVYILPKPQADPVACSLLPTSALTDFSSSGTTMVHDKGMQTDPVEPRRKKTVSPSKASFRRRASAQTQTGGTLKIQHPKKTAETQTMGDYILKKAMADADILTQDIQDGLSLPYVARKRKHNSGTQTAGKKPSKGTSKCSEPVLEKGINAMSLSPCSSFCLKKDVGLPDLWVGDKNTSSTQTAPETESALLQRDLNLELFSQDEGLCSASNLQSIFEDNSDSFDNVVDGTSNFDNMSRPGTSMNSLDSLSEATFISCNVTQTDQNLNHLFLRDEESHAAFTMRTNTETQTTEELADLDSLLYSNMWTQTSGEALFSALDFADIQTQTAWPLYGGEGSESVLVSAETQTAISSSAMGAYTSMIDDDCWSSELSHIETQTCEEDLKDFMAELE